jgi:hypothetical protein
MTTIYLDVETLPGMTAESKSKARRDTHAPGTLKKSESITTWWATEGDAAIELTWRKQALDPAAGELAAIGWAIDDDAPECVVRGLEETEGDYLRRALAVIDARLQAAAQPADPLLAPWLEDLKPYFVGFNAQFDAGFLRARGWANRVLVPRWLPSAFARAPRDYGCTMLAFSGYGGRISLDRLSRALGVPSPKADGVDGGEVLDLWRDGHHQELAAYCLRDVQATRAVWQIMAGHYCAPDAAEEVTV